MRTQVKAEQVAAGGAVLVFLPGAPEIGKAARALSGHLPLHNAAGGMNKLCIVSLYGSLSSQDQAKVFNRCESRDTYG
jgi:ATP-dependent RNA helicase DHX57